MLEAAETIGIQVQAGPELFGLLLAFARVTGLLHSAPLVSTNNVPVMVRVGFGAMIVLAITPVIDVGPEVMTWGPAELGFRVCSELLLGLAMGFAATLLLSVLDILGTFIGVNSQLAIAMSFDPITNSQQIVTTRLIQVAGFLLFLAADLHHQVLYGLVDSFAVAPAGTGVLAVGAGPELSMVLSELFLDAMRISMPVVVTVLVMNLVAALVTRFAQQMNIYFSVGLPANAAAGLFATGLAIPALATVVYARGSSISSLMLSMIGG